MLGPAKQTPCGTKIEQKWNKKDKNSKLRRKVSEEEREWQQLKGTARLYSRPLSGQDMRLGRRKKEGKRQEQKRDGVVGMLTAGSQ